MILVCGEALIDCFVAQAGQTLSMRCLTGGSPYNLAIGLARLGRDASYFGAISDDLFGEHLYDHLAREGVATTYVKRSTRPTTLSFVQAGTSDTRYSFRGGATADRDIVDDDVPRLLSPDVRCVTFGSYSLAVEPVGSSLERFALRLDGERVISLDPNVRPSLIENCADWRKRLMRLLRVATIVKTSDEDLFNTFGISCDLDAFATQCLADGASLVIVTRGPRSILAFGRFGRIEIDPPKMDVVDTVGAGDAFHAALLAHLDERRLLDRHHIVALDRGAVAELVLVASTVAAITCTRRGADPPRTPELRAALARLRPG